MPPIHVMGCIDSGHGCPPGGAGVCPCTIPAIGSPNVLAAGSPVVRFGDSIVPHICTSGGPHSGIFIGVRNVLVNGQPAQAVGDMVSCTSFALTGINTVLVGP